MKWFHADLVSFRKSLSICREEIPIEIEDLGAPVALVVEQNGKSSQNEAFGKTVKPRFFKIVREFAKAISGPYSMDPTPIDVHARGSSLREKAAGLP